MGKRRFSSSRTTRIYSRACTYVSARTTTTRPPQQDAISCMAEARKSEPDLIILDLGLPAGDGFLLMDKFKKVPSLATVPVIVVSGRDIRENQRKIIQSGAKAFLQKPVDNAMLLAVIRTSLGEETSKEEPLAYNRRNP